MHILIVLVTYKDWSKMGKDVRNEDVNGTPKSIK